MRIEAIVVWCAFFTFSCLFVLGFITYVYLLYFFLLSLFSGAPIGLLKLVYMCLRRVNPSIIVRPYIMGVNAGLALSIDDLIVHCRAGGNVERVVMALIAAKKANTGMSFHEAIDIDLSGDDVLDVVRSGYSNA